MIPSYDTVNCWLPRDYIKDAAQENCILDKLSNVGHSYKESTGHTQYGQLGNLALTITERRISIRGSLCKYYYGDNLHPLNLNDTKLAIEKLSDNLLLPIGNAQVSRLDLASNISMQHPVSLYLHYLGLAKSYTRLENPKSVTYNKSNLKLSFYDKVAEMKQKKITMPPAVRLMHLLRYEMSYIKQIDKQLKRNVTVGILYQPAFYHSIVDHWHKGYLAILKERSIRIGSTGLDIIDNPRLLGELALIKTYGGVMATLEALEEAKQLKPYTDKRRTAASRLSRRVKELASHSEYTFQSPLIDELDQKIAEAVNYALLQ
ncbi:phage/plasmid replication domain-containing protein [Pontibacter vulgaris]|uniref:phage/plasmid replication domain-containing protein n=1 Tax=Pontibacter vulgaris TaxID=2905679 RepID=UPI001FA6C111|nr:phage/plasmid replication protein [Pontibacter vulgaris]